jgi:hypothetical protein
MKFALYALLFAVVSAQQIPVVSSSDDTEAAPTAADASTTEAPAATDSTVVPDSETPAATESPATEETPAAKHQRKGNRGDKKGQNSGRKDSGSV